MEPIERVERRVKLRDLHTLIVLVQCGSMGKAAKQLAISQPVVSKTIAELEHAVGVRLLDRTPQGVEATVYGRALLECGTAVFDDLRRGMQEIAFLSDPTAGELRIGGAGPFVDGLIPAVVSGLAERFPKIEFHVTEGDPAALCRLVRERHIDLAILRTSASIYDDDLALAPLFAEPLFVIAGLDNPLSRRRRLGLGDLLDEPWAFPEPGNVARTLIEEAFRSAGLATPTAQVVSDSTTMRTRLAELGRFLTFLPASTLRFAATRRRIRVLPLKLAMKAPPIEIVTLRNRAPNPIARLFISELYSVAKPLDDSCAANVEGDVMDFPSG